MNVCTAFRQLIEKPELVVAPGAFECITARFIEQAGYPAVYMSGAATAATLGYPDYGLTTLTEMADNAGRIAGAVDIPVIADADTGFGNRMNAARTVMEYERRGVAGLHIEDQKFPKRCGHLEGKEIVPLAEFVDKIRAACDARVNRDFTIIARTDARSVLGLNAAIDRANAALSAGADMAFVEAPQTLEEMAQIPSRVEGPCMLNLVWKGKTPDVPFAKAQEMGYRLLILPSLLFKSMMAACDKALHETVSLGRHAELETPITPQAGFDRLGGLQWDRISQAASPIQDDDHG
ncbi:oxaloacetate decarboxylase [Pseudochelatococcus lubricantis]|uniref:isocitrate lyase/PEP mutase family protein n=1 Tax=Pseudochelatococcus lubricantis TaxID=1538102 RepID=UPI0035E6CD3F